MKKKLIALLLLVFLVGCTKNTIPKPVEPTDPIIPNVESNHIVYLNENKVLMQNVETKEVTLILNSNDDIDIIVPNPTMKVIAYTTKEKSNVKGRLKIFDYDSNKTIDISSVENEIPFVSWSEDGCSLMLFQSSLGGWGDLLVYNFVTQEISKQVQNIGEPSFNIDSNRIVAHIPQQLDKPVPFDDGSSSSVVVYNVAENTMDIILEGTNKSIYRVIKWLDSDTIAYRYFNVNNEEEQIHMLNLKTQKDENITDRVNEIIFKKPEVPKEFYEYQYYELSPANNYAILSTMNDNENKIEIYSKKNNTITFLANGYCAYWVKWKQGIKKEA